MHKISFTRGVVLIVSFQPLGSPLRLHLFSFPRYKCWFEGHARTHTPRVVVCCHDIPTLSSWVEMQG